MAFEKVLICNLENGESWAVPLRYIAADRARYYLERDGADTTFEQEYDFCMNDEYEASDWFQNNMNASQIRDHFKLLSPPKHVSFDDKFRNCECEIGELDL